MKPAPPASAFTERPDAQPLLAWSTAQQRCLQDLLHKLLIDWQTAWSTGGAVADVTIGIPATGSEERVLWSLEGVPAQQAEATARRALEATLFGSEVHAPAPVGAAPVIALEVAQAAWSDWQQRLQAALGTSPALSTDDLPDSHGTGTVAPIWSGALCAKLPWCGTSWSLQLPGPVVQRLLRSAGAAASAPSGAAVSSPLVDLASALHAQALTLHARLSDVTLTLGELEQLAIGDVVRLPQRLDAPLQLMGPRDEPLCEAWLGQQSGRVALELAPLATPV